MCYYLVNSIPEFQSRNSTPILLKSNNALIEKFVIELILVKKLFIKRLETKIRKAESQNM